MFFFSLKKKLNEDLYRLYHIDCIIYADEHLDNCDMCLVIGTSSVVYPAAMFAPQVAARGVPVAEFNMETTPATDHFGFHFGGPCAQILPTALAP